MNNERVLLHTRQVHYRCYRRGDGLWEIEGEMRDFRSYDTVVAEKGDLPAGTSVHHMLIALVVDEDLTVRDIVSRMKAVPFRVCREIEKSLTTMVGVRMGYGWRHTINERLGGTESCTHLRELLVNMATAAFQAIPTWQAQQRKHRGEDPLNDAHPHYLNQCRSWRIDGPVVREHLPQFYQPNDTAGTEPGKE